MKAVYMGVLLILCLFSVAKVNVNLAAASPIFNVYVDPDIAIYAPGTTFNLIIKIAGVPELYGWEFNVTWDHTLLRLDDVGNCSFLWPVSTGYDSFNVSNWDGAGEGTYLRPEADGFYTEYDTVSGVGSHWEAVSEEIPDTTSYIATAVNGDRDLFNLPNMPLESPRRANITSVRVFFRAMYATGGSGAKVRALIRTHDTDYTGPDVTLTSGYRTYNNEWQLNPFTNQVWTRDEVNALQVGVQSAAAFIHRVTQVYVLVRTSVGWIFFGETVTGTNEASGYGDLGYLKFTVLPGASGQTLIHIKPYSPSAPFGSRLVERDAVGNIVNIPPSEYELYDGKWKYPVTFITGDVNQDGKVNIMDLARIGVKYGYSYTPPPYIPEDVVRDGVINIQDLATCARMYGQYV